MLILQIATDFILSWEVLSKGCEKSKHPQKQGPQELMKKKRKEELMKKESIWEYWIRGALLGKIHLGV